MSNVVTLQRLVIKRVKMNWYMGRVPGACFFARSRSEIVLKHRRWAIAREIAEQAHQMKLVSTALRVAALGGR